MHIFGLKLVYWPKVSTCLLYFQIRIQTSFIHVQDTQKDTILQFRWSIGTISTNRKLCHSNGSIGAKQVRF